MHVFHMFTCPTKQDTCMARTHIKPCMRKSRVACVLAPPLVFTLYTHKANAHALPLSTKIIHSSHDAEFRTCTAGIFYLHLVPRQSVQHGHTCTGAHTQYIVRPPEAYSDRPFAMHAAVSWVEFVGNEMSWWKKHYYEQNLLASHILCVQL